MRWGVLPLASSCCRTSAMRRSLRRRTSAASWGARGEPGLASGRRRQSVAASSPSTSASLRARDTLGPAGRALGSPVRHRGVKCPRAAPISPASWGHRGSTGCATPAGLTAAGVQGEHAATLQAADAVQRGHQAGTRWRWAPRDPWGLLTGVACHRQTAG